MTRKTDIQDSTAMPANLDNAIQTHLGEQLRALYGDPALQKIPRDLTQLLARVSQVIRAHQEPVDQDFINGIMSSIPNLRGFAISLTKNVDRAEDLVQDTVLKALSKRDSFQEGTNLRAWLFTILRNNFFSTHRKKGREVEDADGAHAATMVSIPDQHDKLVHQDLQAALARLSPDQRDVIILVGAEGMSYDEAAEALGCAVGTVKSRVNRARNRLAELMGLAGEDGIGGSRSRSV